MLSQSGSIGTNPISTAPPAVPDSAPMSTGVAGGLRSVTPVEVPSTESPGVVLPTCQEDPPPSPPLPPPFFRDRKNLFSLLFIDHQPKIQMLTMNCMNRFQIFVIITMPLFLETSTYQ